MRPYFPKVENGITCLLVETNRGPVLVDTGFGLGDYLSSRRSMRLFLEALRSPRDVNETAIHQIQRLGYQPSDVQHIFMTHLHLDHAGGLPDFPLAKVHLYQPEYDHITSGSAGWAFFQEHWEHEPDWVTHKLAGDKWYEFDAIRLDGFEPEMWLVPLVGHTPGHSGFAICHEKGWILHAGDAVPFDVKVEEVPDWISRLAIGPHVPRMRELMKKHPEVQVIGAHMELGFYTN